MMLYFKMYNMIRYLFSVVDYVKYKYKKEELIGKIVSSLGVIYI